jgi:sugar phosphate isomerase/epimerase
VVKASKLLASFEELNINSDPEQNIFCTFLHEMMSNLCVLGVTALFFLLDFCHTLYCGSEISARFEQYQGRLYNVQLQDFLVNFYSVMYIGE